MGDPDQRADWDDFAAELDAWQRDGHIVTFWWRDDDATRTTEPLERLLSISASIGVPISLAVIPRDVDDSLVRTLNARPDAAVLQHGFAHANHAPGEDRQEEYGPHRPRDVMLDEMAEGWRRLERFEGRLPVMVAPWNRMDEGLVPDLPAAGLAAVSTWGPGTVRRRRPASNGPTSTSISWIGTALAASSAMARCLTNCSRILSPDALTPATPASPPGLMTHHSFHDEGCWDFIERFLAVTTAHPVVRWLETRTAFWP